MVFGSREMVSGHRSMVLPGSDMPSALGLVFYVVAWISKLLRSTFEQWKIGFGWVFVPGIVQSWSNEFRETVKKTFSYGQADCKGWNIGCGPFWICRRAILWWDYFDNHEKGMENAFFSLKMEWNKYGDPPFPLPRPTFLKFLFFCKNFTKTKTA